MLHFFDMIQSDSKKGCEPMPEYDDSMKDISDRLKIILSNSQISQTQFADSLYMSYAHISKALRGQALISKSTADYICIKYGYNLNWLLYGQEPMRDKKNFGNVDLEYLQKNPTRKGKKSETKENLIKYIDSLTYLELLELKRHIKLAQKDLDRTQSTLSKVSDIFDKLDK